MNRRENTSGGKPGRRTAPGRRAGGRRSGLWGPRLLALCLLLGPFAVGAEEEKKPLLSEPTWRAIKGAQTLMEEGQWDKAEARLKKLQPRVSDRPYEAAVTAQTLGFLYSSQRRYAQAIDAFQAALAEQALPGDVSHDLRYNLGQLLVAEERYAQGIEVLQRWLSAEPEPDAQVYRLLAGAHYRLQDYAGAVPWIGKVLAAGAPSEDGGDTWRLMLLGCYQELADLDGMVTVLEELVRLRPDNRQYWLQLAATYQRMERDRAALAAYELAERRGLLEAEQLLRMARLYIYLDMPYRSARLVERSLGAGTLPESVETLELLAEAWLRAAERDSAASAYERLARLSGEGPHWLRAGQLRVDGRQWAEAIAPLERALEAGGLEQPARARLLLGMASAESGQGDKAREALEAALSEESTRAQAQWWLGRLKSPPRPPALSERIEASAS